MLTVPEYPISEMVSGEYQCWNSFLDIKIEPPPQSFSWKFPRFSGKDWFQNIRVDLLTFSESIIKNPAVWNGLTGSVLVAQLTFTCLKSTTITLTKVWNMFKLKHNNTGTTPIGSGVFVVNFRRNQVNFLVYGQDSKKIRSVGRQNRNNIIWFLGSTFFKEYSKHRKNLVIYNFVIIFFFQNAENNRLKKASQPKFCNIFSFCLK